MTNKEKNIQQISQALIYMCSWYELFSKKIFKDYVDEVNRKYMKLPTIQTTRNRRAIAEIAKMEDSFRDGKKYTYDFKIDELPKMLEEILNLKGEDKE